jgi:hypothetical protein
MLSTSSCCVPMYVRSIAFTPRKMSRFRGGDSSLCRSGRRHRLRCLRPSMYLGFDSSVDDLPDASKPFVAVKAACFSNQVATNIALDRWFAGPLSLACGRVLNPGPGRVSMSGAICSLRGLCGASPRTQRVKVLMRQTQSLKSQSSRRTAESQSTAARSKPRCHSVRPALTFGPTGSIVGPRRQ